MIKKIAKKLANRSSAGSSKGTCKKTATSVAKSSSRAKKTTSRRKKVSWEEWNTLIARKAYEMFEKRGYSHGNDQADWYEAEKMVGKTYKV
jgi:hypothetical protein